MKVRYFRFQPNGQRLPLFQWGHGCYWISRSIADGWDAWCGWWNLSYTNLPLDRDVVYLFWYRVSDALRCNKIKKKHLGCSSCFLVFALYLRDILATTVTSIQRNSESSTDNIMGNPIVTHPILIVFCAPPSLPKKTQHKNRNRNILNPLQN